MTLLGEIAPLGVVPGGVEVQVRDPVAGPDVLLLPQAPQDLSHSHTLSVKITYAIGHRAHNRL